ncbi:tetratricopeptide repeat protein, partial [candidate division KSB1 bacterium]|nr:tetratricopeptide repeat protein [candidate division KSB1 bacterium]
MMMPPKQIKLMFLFLAFIAMQATAPAQPKPELESQLTLANQYEKLKDFEQALSIYNNVYLKNPADEPAFDGIKRCLSRLKRYDEAIQLIKSRLKQKYSIRDHTDLGTFYFDKGDEREAQRIWKGVIQQNAKDAFAYRAVANAMVASKLFAEAIDVFKLARENVKSSEDFMLELAHLYTIQSDFQHAVREYLSYLKQNPKQYSYVERAILGFTDDSDVVETCLDEINKQLSRESEDTNLRQLLAGIYMKLERFDDALREYKRMDDVQRGNEAKTNHGRNLMAFGNRALQDGAYSHAHQAFSIILEKYPDSRYKS